METRHIFAAVMLVSLLNGLFSPVVALVWKLLPFLFPIVSETGPGFVAMVSALALAVTTLVLAGVPAAIYERVTGQRTTAVSAAIWLAGTVFLSLPTILGFSATLTRP
jgi:hypothetical protein